MNVPFIHRDRPSDFDHFALFRRLSRSVWFSGSKRKKLAGHVQLVKVRVAALAQVLRVLRGSANAQSEASSVTYMIYLCQAMHRPDNTPLALQVVRSGIVTPGCSFTVP
jgi:hypothetical protein